MSIATIEMNDIAIRIDNDEHVVTSPGYAVVDGDRLLIGENGRANARLLPRWRNNRFWQLLDTNPLNDATPNIRHHADLVFSHLESLADELNNSTDLVLLVPSDYTSEQMALLLGICKELGIPVSAMLDSGVAAAMSATHHNALFVEIYLHRWVVTTINAGPHIQRTGAQTVGNRGWSALMDQWAGILAGKFIAEHRYDPTHQARSEQQLYDRIPQWLMNQDQPPALDIGEASRTITMTDAEWRAACSEQIAALTSAITTQVANIAGSDTVEILLGEHASMVPGLAASLGLIDGVKITSLSPDTLSARIRQHGEVITTLSPDVTHIVQLPISIESAPVTGSMTRVTHVLCGHTAHRIEDRLDVTGVRNGHLISNEDPAFTLVRHGAQTLIDPVRTVTLNGEPTTDSAAVVPGDVIAIDDCDLLLISDA